MELVRAIRGLEDYMSLTIVLDRLEYLYFVKEMVGIAILPEEMVGM